MSPSRVGAYGLTRLNLRREVIAPVVEEIKTSYVADLERIIKDGPKGCGGAASLMDSISEKS